MHILHSNCEDVHELSPTYDYHRMYTTFWQMGRVLMAAPGCSLCHMMSDFRLSFLDFFIYLFFVLVMLKANEIQLGWVYTRVYTKETPNPIDPFHGKMKWHKCGITIQPNFVNPQRPLKKQQFSYFENQSSSMDPILIPKLRSINGCYKHHGSWIQTFL